MKKKEVFVCLVFGVLIICGGVVSARIESCNTKDDDGDGLIDEGCDQDGDLYVNQYMDCVGSYFHSDSNKVIAEVEMEDSIVEINEGWNLLGFPVENETSVEDFRNAGCVVYDYVWSYDYEFNNYVQSESVEAGKAYWVYSLNDCEFDLTPHGILDVLEIEMDERWNLVPGFSGDLMDSYIKKQGTIWGYVNGQMQKVRVSNPTQGLWVYWNSAKNIPCSRVDDDEAPLGSVPVGPNKKKMNMYSEDLREVFLVSDKNWKDVLPLVPVTTWTQQDGDDSECQRGYGTPENVCVYPTLIWHDEEAVDEIEISEEDFEFNRYWKTEVGISSLSKTFLRIGDQVDLKINVVNNDVYPKSCFIPSIISKPAFTELISDLERCDYDNPLNPGESRSFIFSFNLPEFQKSFDIDSSIYFMQQFDTEKVTRIGETPEELDNLLIAEKDFGAEIQNDKEHLPENIGVENYLGYWKEYKDVVYVQEDYELGLVASTYASLLNAPLIIEGTELDEDSNFEGRNVICVSKEGVDFGRACDENYNLEQLQQKYVDMTEVYDGNKTDKIILTNPNDLDIHVEEEFQPEKSANPVYEIYGKTSLASPILASAKHEIIITTRESDYEKVDEKIEEEVGRLNLDFFDDSSQIEKLSFQNSPQGYLYLYDLSTGEKIKVDSISTHASNFAIDKNRIIWTKTGLDQGVYTYDLESDSSMKLDTFGTFVGVFDNIFIWSKSSKEILIYDTLFERNKTIFLEGYVQSNGLHISNGKVVWIEKNNAINNIYLYDLDGDEKRKIVSSPNIFSGLSFSNGNIVWAEKRDKRYPDIFLYDLDTNIETQITNDSFYQSSVSILDNKVVWKDTRNGSSDIFLYDLDTNIETQITNDFFYQDFPVLINNKIIFKDSRFGYKNLYLYDLDTNIETQITNDPFSKGLMVASDNNVLFSASEGLKTPFYLKGVLTLFAINNSIPLRSKDNTPVSSSRTLDATEYSDFGKDYLPDISVGRIQGITISDVSSYLSRDLFYNKISGNFNNVSFLVGNGADDWNGAMTFAGARVHTLADKFNAKNYFATCFTGENYSDSCNSYSDLNKVAIFQNLLSRGSSIFLAHHGAYRFCGIYSEDIEDLDTALVFTESCSTCSRESHDSFCMNIIRQGSLGIIAAIDLAYSMGGNNFRPFMSIYSKDFSLGQTYSYSFEFSNGYMYSNFGDPTFKPHVPYKLEEPLEWN